MPPLLLFVLADGLLVYSKLVVMFVMLDILLFFKTFFQDICC